MDSPSGDVVVGNIIGSSVVDESSDSVVESSCWSPDPSSGVSSVWSSKYIYISNMTTLILIDMSILILI